jgi:probable HAF family extracellular repeat protein
MRLRFAKLIIAWAYAAFALFSAPIYRVVDLGTLGGKQSEGYAIASNGRVAGGALNGGGYQAAYVYSGSQMEKLYAPGEARASGINDLGQVAGTVWSSKGAQAAVWTNGAHQSVGTLGGTESYGAAINNSGALVGGSLTASGQLHAFRASNGKLQDLGTLGVGGWSTALGINDVGSVTGYADTGGALFRAFRWTESEGMQSLGTLGGALSYGMAINNKGAVVGTSSLPNGYMRAFLEAGSGLVSLGTLGGLHSYGYGVNNRGDAVGGSLTRSNQTHAFVYRDGILYDLNALVPELGGWMLQWAYAINDSGQIAGSGLLNGQLRAFRLDPVTSLPLLRGAADQATAFEDDVSIPEPSYVPAVFGVLGFGFFVWRRCREG